MFRTTPALDHTAADDGGGDAAHGDGVLSETRRRRRGSSERGSETDRALQESSATDAAPAVDAGMSFEDAMADVESIIARIDDGEIGLEASLDAWERGMSLLRHCRSILDRAEQRVQKIKLDHAAESAAPAGSGPGASGDAGSGSGKGGASAGRASSGPGSAKSEGSKSACADDIPF